MITVNDKRTSPAAISTGRPAQAPVDGEMVHVQPTTYYMQGSEHVGPHSEPYPIAKHIAAELEGNGFARIVEAPKPAGDAPPPAGGEGDPDEADEEDEADDESGEGEGEGDQPDDTSRAPEQGQVTASTVPPTPGAEPQRPASPSPVPPAATSEPARGRRGRRGRRGA